ncbi:MAG: flagellar protein FliS [Lachnospiraceae bacterium]|nr:flagellar protein FliS [Lachnospiraceae bacterium]
MTKELIQDYTLKISQANPTGIIVLVYDIADQYIKDALASFDAADYEEYRQNCRNACRCVEDLLGALDYNYELAVPLMRLYVFINREISLASAKNDTEGLLNARGLLISLKDAFEQVAKEDHSDPMLYNTQSVYAGLTYGRNQLQESVSDPAGSRGFMA